MGQGLEERMSGWDGRGTQVSWRGCKLEERMLVCHYVTYGPEWHFMDPRLISIR